MDKERFHTLPSCGHQKARERGGEGGTKGDMEMHSGERMWDRHESRLLTASFPALGQGTGDDEG